MSDSTFEIVALKYGGYSLRSVERGETFHPGIGPVEEARLLHIQQQDIATRARELGRFVLWDVGLGAAANAVAALGELEGVDAEVEIHSFDKSLNSLRFALENSETLPYLNPYRELVSSLVAEGEVRLGGLRWVYHHGDFRTEMRKGGISAPNSIFYDPYSPATNREMWTLHHFEGLRQVAGPDCLLSTYTRSTAVRVTLLLAGFFVGTGCEIGEKAETTVAASRLSLLKRPLPNNWLERVKVSRNGSPMRDPVYSITPISAADLSALRRHPQFNS